MKDYLDNNGVRYLWTKIKNRINSDIANKQDKLTGTSDQIVGFDLSGNMVAKDSQIGDINSVLDAINGEVI